MAIISPNGNKKKMEPLSLKEALSSLKESSMSAIADAGCKSFDETKKYLHLDRDIEGQLKIFLESVKKSDSKKLFLVCGNVGDGKSHLLASIRINNPELLTGVILHNDATESSEPDISFVDELNKLLDPFSDSKITQGNEKIVLAINLGTLNNFLAADEENRFEKLKVYVKANKILEVGDIVECQFIEGSPFQFVNFCDHNLFYLTKDGPISDIIETAIERVVSQEGPFFEAYESQKKNYPDNCPICFNFEALQSASIRRRISSLLIECLLKGEIILSIRALYNFIYELIIPVSLEQLDSRGAIKCIGNYTNSDFLQNILPNYIFSHPELSNIFEQIQKHDPATRRGEIIDETIIELMVSGSPTCVINKYIQLDAVGENLAEIFLNISAEFDFVNTFIRTTFFWPKTDNNLLHNLTYESYLRLMFDWYSGDGKTLKSLYKLVQHAVTSWNGQSGAEKINIDIGRQQLEYRISENISLKPDPPVPPETNAETIRIFNTFLPLRFRVDGKTIPLAVTYNLFALVDKIKDGYRPTNLDHSNFVVFDDFVQNVAAAGGEKKQVFFTDSANKHQFVLELDDFDEFCFNEVAE